MSSIRSLSRKFKHIIAASALVAATIVPAVVPEVVSAATVTNRSIELSNSSVSATGVTYKVDFTSVGAAGAFIIDFCSNTPLIGQSCTAPTGFNVTSAASATAGFTTVDDINSSTVMVTGTIGTGADVSVELSGITNPSTAGPLYARIVTYSSPLSSGGFGTYSATSLPSGAVDQGSVAISITNTIQVTGAVLESMIFCVSGAAITENCGTTTSPVIELGETQGSVKALSSSAVSSGNIHTQISTNAAGGAVISLKSNASGCGGLKRAGAPNACDIAPALNTDISAGQAKFGLKTATATNTGSGASGVLQAKSGSIYNDTTYALNYTAEDEETNISSSGVTSPYGDPLLDTGNAPANNKNMQLTFGASVSNSTPAGTYSANLSLIATGKF